jgi:hypothetical protein
MMTDVARKMWRTLEPLHGMIYFVPEAPAGYAQLGLFDRSGYFVSRAAPMGAVTSAVVVATFFNFHPDLVARAMAGAWDRTTPADVLAVRLRAADLALRRILGDALDGAEMEEAAALSRRAAEACTPQGRPLAAGHLALAWPEAPHLQLWHAVSILREYRGDGHIAALVTEAVDGLQAAVAHAATGDVPREILQRTRTWSDEEWEGGEAALCGRGWLDAHGALTEAGRAHRQWVEDRTDALAMPPWEHLGPQGCERLRELARPLRRAVVDAGTFSFR